MIDRLQIFLGRSHDPYRNLAVEQYLFQNMREDCAILYLWQNQNTVVIGRNQNPWQECRTSLLETEGGHLARRLSGGGAVYHDLGNLNFTFLTAAKHYDLQRQNCVILKACQDCGIPAQCSGRNDLTVEGRKFSGSAFYKKGDRAFHHGTLMVQVDKEKLGRYLSPSKAKLAAKAVASVRARVANLTEYAPDLTCQEMEAGMRAAFETVYGKTAEILQEDTLDPAAVESLRRHYAGKDWIYGTRSPFSFEACKRFDWGEVTLQLLVEGGTVKTARVYTDSMDWSWPGALEAALTGVRFRPDDLIRCIRAATGKGTPLQDDLCNLILEQEI